MARALGAPPTMNIAQRLEQHGYWNPTFRVLGDGRIAWLRPFLFTVAIVTADFDDPGCNITNRWCYENMADAELALDRWNPKVEEEPQGWHRHPNSGRRRPQGDASREYVNL